jgi:preprotein translocase subunit YajC
MFRNLISFLGTAEGAAEGATEAAGGLAPSSLIQTVIMIGLFGVAMYFLLYRPQKKQEKAINEMRSGLKVGDEISTNGGILGKVIQIKDDFLVIETGNDRTKLKIAKWAVRAVEHREEEEEEDDE